MAADENTRVIFGGGWPPARIRASFSISSAKKRLKHMVVVFGGGVSWWSDLGVRDLVGLWEIPKLFFLSFSSAASGIGVVVVDLVVLLLWLGLWSEFCDCGG